MMRRSWQVAGVLGLLAMAACGGGGSEPFLDEIIGTPDPNRTPGPQGDAAVIEFVVPETESTPGPAAGLTRAIAAQENDDGGIDFHAEIGPVGTARPQASLMRFRVLNARGRPARNGVIVDFQVDGPPDAGITVTEDRTRDGFVQTILIAGPTPGNASVIARVRGTNLIARSAVVVIGRPRGAAAAIEFFGLRLPGVLGTAEDEEGTPESRTQLGIRGAGFAQAVDAVFVVLDANGAAAVDNTIVEFRLFGPNGGESVAPPSAPTANGFVTTTIHTGTRPGPVQIEARVSGTDIIARAIPITIGSALNPPASNLSIAVDCLNVAGSVTFGLENEIRAGLSDQFLNPIPIGSAVSFFTEGGGIQAQGVSEDGFAATALLVTQLPIPADRRVTVLAVTTGQETFTDVNRNGRFDPGEPFLDLGPEPFLDANENGRWDPGEFFLDVNNNGLFDGTPDGVWNDQILISFQGAIIFSGRTVVSIEPTTIDVPTSGSQTFILRVADDIGSPLVGGSTIELEATNVDVFPTRIVIPDTNVDTRSGPVPGVTEFIVTLVDSGSPAPAPSPPATPEPRAASLTISVESEGSDDGKCPGGNGNATLTITGSVGD